MQQAKVYMTLVMLGSATVKTIAASSQMNRAEIYRVIPRLEELGLITKIISAPVAFSATPLSEGLSLLLEHHARQFRSLQRQAAHVLRNFKGSERMVQDNSEYYLTKGPKLVERKYLRDLQEVQNSKDCILDWEIIIGVVNRDRVHIKEALKRGVKIRYIACARNHIKVPRLVKTLMDTGSFQLKFASTIPKAGVDIFDGKIAHFVVIPKLNRERIEVLRTTNWAVVDLAQDYFDLKWQSATTPHWRHKKLSNGNNNVRVC